jgi:hypothetical protein
MEIGVVNEWSWMGEGIGLAGSTWVDRMAGVDRVRRLDIGGIWGREP